jgi:glycosyltransferase involved in cell wall biosynthesis
MTKGGRPQVAVIYHFYPHYRKAIVEQLARSTCADFTFIGDDHEYLHSIEPAKLSGAVKFQLAPTHHVGGPFMWQWGAFTACLNPAWDTVIMHAVPHWPCTWMGALAARLLGKRVFFWGHGYLSRPQGLKGIIRRLFYALPHQHMFYGRFSKAHALQCGWPAQKLHVIYNSMDLAEQLAAKEKVTADRPAEIRRQLFGSDQMPVVACTTRLIAMRRLDLLVDAMALLKERGVTANLLLVGDGPERAKLQTQAAACGVPVHFEGACYDEGRLAELLLATSVTVAPSRIGLTAIHSMTYGVPVVSHDDPDDQGPEWEAIVPGKTGSHYAKGDVNSLADAIAQWIQSPYPTAAVKESCRAIIHRFWNPEYQRRAIERAVCGSPADDLFDTRERGS